MRRFECEECPYYWCDEDDLESIWPYCHYRYNDGEAPCELPIEPKYEDDCSYEHDY